MTTTSAAGWLDVTVPIRDQMVHWPGDPGVELTQTPTWSAATLPPYPSSASAFTRGRTWTPPSISFPGTPGIDELDLSRVLGVARVIEIEDTESVKPR